MNTASASALTPLVVSLKDLEVAPENPRALDGPDDLIPDLAASMAPDAAGLLVPILVRKGSKKERPFMVLDGRRRLFALRHLLSLGVVTEDLQIPASLCETQESITAAAITANQARIPIKPADVILAIRALIEKKFSLEKVARALCMDMAEARKYHALARVHIDVLLAFKDNIFDLSVLKLIARIPSLDEQKALADHGRANGRLWAGTVSNYLSDDGLSVASPAIQFIGLEAYRDAGGRTSQDLLGELPDTCLDTDIALRLWTEKVNPLASHLAGLGVEGFVTTEDEADVPETFCSVPYRYNRTKETRDEIAACRTARDALYSTLQEREGEASASAWSDILTAEYTLASAEAAPMAIKAALICVGANRPLDLSFYTTEGEVDAWRAAEAADRPEVEVRPSRNPDPIPKRPLVFDISDRSHTFHKASIEIAVRGFRKTLADNFIVALKFQVASMFQQVVLVQEFGIGEDKALQVSYGRNIQAHGYAAVEGLDKEVVDRLLVYRDAYLASAERPYPWVSSLPFPQLQDLLSLVTAACVWITEEKTTLIRSRARGQLQEVAEEVDFDLRDHWYPDGAFYGQCTRKQLLGFAGRMGCDLAELDGMKKGQLADFVAEQGMARQWLPPALCLSNDDQDVEDGPSNHGEGGGEPDVGEPSKDGSVSDDDRNAA